MKTRKEPFDCSVCGQDVRLPLINFRRMDWIIRLFTNLDDADAEWAVARLISELAKRPKRKTKGRK